MLGIFVGIVEVKLQRTIHENQKHSEDHTRDDEQLDHYTLVHGASARRV